MRKEAVMLVLLLLLIVGCQNGELKEYVLQPENTSTPEINYYSEQINNSPQQAQTNITEPKQTAVNPPETFQVKQAEKLSIPASIENSCIGFKISSVNKTELVNEIGAGWVNMNWPKFRWGSIERAPGVFDFSEHDEIVRTAQQNNVAILAELLPYADWDQANDPNCKAKEHDYLCKPKDMQAYKEFVTKVIERYDGDGKDDMPGLKIPVKYWTVISEPDIKKDPYVIFFVGDEEDYKEVLKETYLSIKQACSDCKVIQGAAAGVESEFIDFWDNFFKIGGGEYFDIADVHYVGIDIATGRTVGLGDKSTLNAADFKALLDKHNIKKPLWVSEAVIRSSDSKAALKGALDSGATKVFFVENEYATLEQFGAQGLPSIC